MVSTRLRELARTHPTATALVAGDSQFSHADLLQAGAEVRQLLEHAGVGRGDVVMISLPFGRRAVSTFVACADLGSIFFPVNTAWRAAELSWLAAQVTPRVVVVKREDTTRWTEAGVAADRFVFEDRLDPTSSVSKDAAARAWPDDHPAVYLCTSGSTGHPRIVARTHGKLLRSATATAAAVSFGPGRRLLATVPLHHGNGFSNNLLLPLLSGGTLILLERFEPAAAADMIEHHAIDTLWGSPAVYGLLVDAGVPAKSLSSLRSCFSGGAPLAPAVAEEWRRRYRIPIRQSYGSTETGLVCIQLDDMRSDGVGQPLPDTTIRILHDGRPLGSGEVGEVVVRGPSVLDGYVAPAEESAPRYWRGFYRTGDLGWLDERGQLHLVGRTQPWINIGGVKVDPNEVRLVLSQMLGVRDCLVEAERGPRGIDLISATIAPEPGVELTRADVIRHCRQHLAEYKIPRVLRFVPALVTDLTGKVPK